MATYNKYEVYVEDFVRGVHDWDAHTLKVALTNAAPNLATHTVLANITDLTTGGGYTAGGNTTTISISRSGGTVTVDGTDVVFTATTGFGPFQYAVLYNDTPTSPADPLVCNWNYGSAVTLAAAETFTVDTGSGAGNDLFTLT